MICSALIASANSWTNSSRGLSRDIPGLLRGALRSLPGTPGGAPAAGVTIAPAAGLRAHAVPGMYGHCCGTAPICCNSPSVSQTHHCWTHDPTVPHRDGWRDGEVQYPLRLPRGEELAEGPILPN